MKQTGKSFRFETVRCGFCVVGGGMSGVLAALAAARRGIDTVLVNDRPVPGGNASKEIRMVVNGADGGANNRYFRETGILEEIRLENLKRNPDGNAEAWNALLLDRLLGQDHLRLFQNTTVCAAGKKGNRLGWVEGIQLGSERRFRFAAEYYADATGDGTVGFLAGARWMYGREARSRFGESLAPRRAERRTMGDTILYAAKDAGKPVEFVPPAWAHRFTEKSFQWRWLPDPKGGNLWWLEYGGIKDAIRDNEEIRTELWRIVYGVWDFVKNSPKLKDRSRNLDLEWVGAIPGKRESRRLVGDHVLTQKDLVERPDFPDAVAYGGWTIDDHPSAGFYSRRHPSSHYSLPGMYNIPLRSLYSADVPNLFYAGRDASLSHVAMASTRVMATCAQMGEAVGAAAAMAIRKRASPRKIAAGSLATELQQDLLRADHYIVGVRGRDRGEIGHTARVTAQSTAETGLGPPSSFRPLDSDTILMFPAAGDRLDAVRIYARTRRPARLEYVLYQGDPTGNFIPGAVRRRGAVLLKGAFRGPVAIPFQIPVLRGFHWLELKACPGVAVGMTRERRPGIATHRRGSQGGNNWWNDFSPWGHPIGENIAFALTPKHDAYAPVSVVNGYSRPLHSPNLWVSAKGLPQWLDLRWDRPRKISLVQVRFDTDLDRGYSNLWAKYGANTVPSCVRDYRISALVGGRMKPLETIRGNYQRLRECRVRARTTALRIEILATNGDPRAKIYEVRIY